MASISTPDAGRYNASLSRRELEILTGWEREQRVQVTIADLRALVGASAARDIARVVPAGRSPVVMELMLKLHRIDRTAKDAKLWR